MRRTSGTESVVMLSGVSPILVERQGASTL